MQRLAFAQNFYFSVNSEPLCLRFEALYRLFHRVAAQAEGPIVHRHHLLGSKFDEGAHRLFRAGVHGAVGVWKIGTYGQEGNFGFEFCADLAEAVEVSGIARVVDRLAAALDDISAVATGGVAKHSCSPMLAGSHGYGEALYFNLFPPCQAVNPREAKALHEILYAARHHDLGSLAG